MAGAGDGGGDGECGGRVLLFPLTLFLRDAKSRYCPIPFHNLALHQLDVASH